MTILELKEKYSHNELFSQNSDLDIRLKVFTSLFNNLFENKIVIHDRFTCIAKIEQLEILPDFFSAFVIPQTFIPTGKLLDKRLEAGYERLKRGWTASCRWDNMRILGTSLCSSPYSCWLMWVDPKTVEMVETLTKVGKYNDALDLTFHENN